jgi:hypothetical protein
VPTGLAHDHPQLEVVDLDDGLRLSGDPGIEHGVPHGRKGTSIGLGHRASQTEVNRGDILPDGRSLARFPGSGIRPGPWGELVLLGRS